MVLGSIYLFVNERITKTKKQMISQQRYMGKALKPIAIYLSSIDVIQNKVQFISCLKRVMQSLKCSTKRLNYHATLFTGVYIFTGTAEAKEHNYLRGRG